MTNAGDKVLSQSCVAKLCERLRVRVAVWQSCVCDKVMYEGWCVPKTVCDKEACDRRRVTKFCERWCVTKRVCVTKMVCVCVENGV